MTKQEYYDLLVASAADGTFPSVEAGSARCMYRGSNGSKCAVGVLIPDERYEARLERKSVFDELVLQAVGRLPAGMSPDDLHDVQCAHDSLTRREWNADAFVRSINRLSCFADVNRKEVPA